MEATHWQTEEVPTNRRSALAVDLAPEVENMMLTKREGILQRKRV